MVGDFGIAKTINIDFQHYRQPHCTLPDIRAPAPPDFLNKPDGFAARLP
jgi:hypothetical protein